VNTMMDCSERLLVKYPLFTAAVKRIQECFDSYGTSAEPACCPIVGESGSGKTTIIAHFASLHPRVDHKHGVEQPVLLAKVPARPRAAKCTLFLNRFKFELLPNSVVQLRSGSPQREC